MKKIILALFLLSVYTWGQDVDLTVQTGHSASINTVLFSPDDKFVASSGDDNKIVIDKEEIEKEFRIKLESIIEEKTGCEEEEMDEEIIESKEDE